MAADRLAPRICTQSARHGSVLRVFDAFSSSPPQEAAEGLVDVETGASG
jgi:hypothetical protein